MKRVIAFLVTVTMLLSLFPLGVVTAFAAGNAKAIINIESVSGALDSYVDVAIDISENPGIASMGLTLSFDKDLTLVGATNGEAFAELTMTPPAQLKKQGSVTGSCRFAWLGSDNCTEVGTILNLRFLISANATLYKDCNISISCDNGDILDNARNPIELTANNGKVTIIDYIPGDVDGSGYINMLDVLTLCQYYVDGCKYDPDGYAINIKAEAGDVDANGKINMLDILTICQYYVDDCKYDPNGYGVKLLPGKRACNHSMQHFDAKAVTCTEDGNIEYWYCTLCNNYFGDADGKDIITYDYTMIKKQGHTVVIDEAIPATNTEKGLTEGSHCSACGEILVAQEEYGPLVANTANITYKVAYTESTTKNGTKTVVSDNYIAAQTIVNNNPNTYAIGTGITELEDISLDGYDFLGWYESPEVGAKRVYSISANETDDKTLYGIWSEKTYSITYKLYKTPLADSIDGKYCSYSISKGLADLPNPTINNYVFLGWYTNDGVEITEIPIGTSGDLVLNAYWTSKRNLAKAKSKTDDPIIVEDTDNGVIYFAYELGTIENIPLSENIWTIQSVSGLSQQKSETYTTSLSQSKADTISNTISNSTVDSGTWTLAEGWNDTTSVTKEWAEQHGLTVQEANEQCLTSSNTFSVTDSQGGSSSTTTTDGTTTVDYNSQNYTHGNSAEFGIEVSAKYSNSTEVSAGVKAGYGPVSAEAGVKNTSTFEIGGKLSADYKQHQETNEHTGTDTTNVHTTVGSSSSTWNSSSTASSTKTASQRNTVSQAVSDIISSKTGYGSSYTKNGQNSQTQGFSNSESNSVNSSSSLTWSSVETHTVTNTYSTDGKSEGCYRLVIAGKAHVFGVVGYDISSKSYFTYTYSIMDDEQYEFLDYAPDLNFNDCENCVLPFEIPFFVYEYSTAATVRTEGLVFRTDSTTNTAIVTKYEGASLDVTIPNYITTGGIAYKVTGISANAFSGKRIRSIILSKFIKELPAGAFKGCTALEQISGYYNVIGYEAFSGCTSLENYNVTASTKSIGEDAFVGVSSIAVNVISSEYALEYADGDAEMAKLLTKNLVNSAVSSGADSVTVSLANIIDGCELTIDVSEIGYFELQGSKDKSFRNLKLNSKAETTIIKNLTVVECDRIPLEIFSDKLTLDTVQINSQGYCLMLPGETEIFLMRDNILTSVNRKAIVCKNPNFVSVSNDGVAGFLEIFGNTYVCGSIRGIDDIEVNNGEIIYITEEDFSKYIKGSFNVSFNVNGGNALTETEKTVYFGSTYGELPTPTRDYYTFGGWFTEADGGVKVTSDTAYNMAVDSVLYAHWMVKPISDWVLESELPENTRVESEKWTYDLTTNITSDKPEVDGYSLYNTTSQWSDYGSWSSWSKSVVSGSDSRQVESKTVTDRAGYTNYRYWVYRTSDGWGYGTQNYNTGSHGYCTVYDEINLSYSLPVYNSSLGTYGPYDSSKFSHSGDSYWFFGESKWIPAVTHTEYRYRDRSLIYTYYHTKTEAMESNTAVAESDTISNVQKWVRYTVK